jgi:hypothetical protein
MAADGDLKIGKPGDDDYFLAQTILDTVAAGTLVLLSWTVSDILPGELLEVTYTQRAGNGKGRVILNIGQTLFEE